MDHPGPPLFAAVGDELELAPRDPDPDAADEYGWRLDDAPDGASVAVGDTPVVHVEPDTAGRYVFVHETPAGTYRQTVRVFGAEHAPGEAPTRQQYSGTEPPTAADHTVPAGTDASEADPTDPGSGLTRLDDETEPERPRLQLSVTTTFSESDTDDEASGVDESGAADADTDDEASGVDESGAADADTVTIAAAVDGPSDARVEFLLDDRDVPAGTTVADLGRVEDGELTLQRSAVEGRLRVHAVAVGDSYSVPDQIDLRVDDSSESRAAADARGDLRVERPYDPPEWALDAVIYEVYVRTFAGEEPEAGDPSAVPTDSAPPAPGERAFDRIRERLDHLDRLGVDVLWLTPVLQNDHAPHGYNITDFLAIADDLGTRADYERLIDAAHDRGMRVIFDLVCNHSARAHPFFRDAYGDGEHWGVGEGSPNPDSDYYDWYEWRDTGEPETYFEWEYIANFQFDTLDVRRHLLDVVDEWAPLVDGFRCDMAWAVPNGFWREVHDRVKAADGEFWLLDETIPYIPEFQAGLFDTHFDSTTAFQLREVGAGDAPTASLLDAVAERRRIGFPEHASFMLYAENHDESRYVSKCGKPAAFAAAGALATLPGTPMVYAGQELGQLGRRDALDWEHADDRLTAHYERLFELRHEEPALRARASLDRVDYDVVSGHDERVVAYHRRAEGEPSADAASGLVVVCNFAEGVAEVALEPPVAGRDLVHEEAVATDPTTVDDVVVLPVE
ncbi:alpha-amylase family glycosyl hydrolase [Halobaculum sp. MBLA0147]|uniref:alpha-amylase family glycosyl hydrolase n=1 Tax=Halobaculum sp. MBLA0147 TaxID=3079934 RepID=UPI0035257EC2